MAAFLKEIEKFYGTKEKNRQGEDLQSSSRTMLISTMSLIVPGGTSFAALWSRLISLDITL